MGFCGVALKTDPKVRRCLSTFCEQSHSRGLVHVTCVWDDFGKVKQHGFQFIIMAASGQSSAVLEALLGGWSGSRISVHLGSGAPPAGAHHPSQCATKNDSHRHMGFTPCRNVWHSRPSASRCPVWAIVSGVTCQTLSRQ